jgi:hypothetical protein
MNNTSMKKALGMLALCSLGLMASGAQADWNRQSHGGHAYQQSRAFSQQIDARQARQMERIHAGKRAGDLTRGEFRELMHQQHTIHAMERRFRADGMIDAREFQRLDRALDVASRSIKTEKNDRQARYAYGHTPYRFN